MALYDGEPVVGTPLRLPLADIQKWLTQTRDGNLLAALQSPVFAELKRSREALLAANSVRMSDYKKIQPDEDMARPLPKRHMEPQRVSGVTTVILNPEQKEQQVDQIRAVQTPIRIVGNTGCGKTTWLPRRMSEQHDCMVLVIEPNSMLVNSAVEYLRHQGESVRKYSVDGEMEARVVYIAADQFLFRLVTDKEAFSEYKIILLDECHVDSGGMEAIKCFLQARTAKHIVGFMTAAEAGYTTGVAGDNYAVEKLEMATMELGDTDFADDHPAHHRNIVDCTMIVLPDSKYFGSYVQYYQTHGVACCQLSVETQESAEIVFQQMRAMVGNPCVLLVDPLFATGVTICVKVVLDWTLRKDYHVDPITGVLTAIYRTAYEEDLIQAAGRAGREDTGYFHMMQRPKPRPLTFQRHKHLYMLLWLRLLDIAPNAELHSASESLGFLTKGQALAMLASGLHPAFLCHYCDGSGVYPEFQSVLEKIVGMKMPTAKGSLRSVSERWCYDRFSFHQWSVKYITPVYPVCSEYKHIAAMLSMAAVSYVPTIHGFSPGSYCAERRSIPEVGDQETDVDSAQQAFRSMNLTGAVQRVSDIWVPKLVPKQVHLIDVKCPDCGMHYSVDQAKGLQSLFGKATFDIEHQCQNINDVGRTCYVQRTNMTSGHASYREVRYQARGFKFIESDIPDPRYKWTPAYN